MQIKNVFISRIYRLPSSFVAGVSFEINNHKHADINEIVFMIEFLFWGIDVQIERGIV